METPSKILRKEDKIRRVDNIILVTVGTTPYQFDRLIREMDTLIQKKRIREEVICQIGNSTYVPKNMEYFRFIEYEKMLDLIKNSNLVITHGGIGSVLLSLKFRKPTIVVPRRKILNEHTNDHQLQITRELEKQGLIKPVYEIKDLYNTINSVKKQKLSKKTFEKSNILKIVDNYLRKLNLYKK